MNSINNTSYTLKPDIIPSQSSSGMLYRLTVNDGNHETTQDLSNDKVLAFLSESNDSIMENAIQKHNEQIQRLDPSTPGQSPVQDGMFGDNDTPTYHDDVIPDASTENTASTVASSVSPRNR